MTKLFVMSIKDSAVQAFNPPFVAPADASAVRDVREIVNSPDSRISKNPDDFELYCVGMWNDQDGTLEPCKARMVARCKDLVKKESNQ